MHSKFYILQETQQSFILNNLNGDVHHLDKFSFDIEWTDNFLNWLLGLP